MKDETEKPVAPPAAPPRAPAAWSPFESLRREIDHLFDNLHAGEWRLPSRAGFPVDLPSTSGMRWHLAPALDLVEGEDAYEMSVELPGVAREAIELKVANGRLTLKGEKKEAREENEGDRHVAERRYGAFTRSLALPEDVNASAIEASHADGVLRILMPKTAEAKRGETRIAIGSGG